MKPQMLFKREALNDITEAYDSVESTMTLCESLAPVIGWDAYNKVREARDALMEARYALDDAR